MLDRQNLKSLRTALTAISVGVRRGSSMRARACTMPGVGARSASLRLARPCTMAHTSTAPARASGTTCSAPEPYPTHASFVMPDAQDQAAITCTCSPSSSGLTLHDQGHHDWAAAQKWNNVPVRRG